MNKRKPERINEIMTILLKKWEESPDLRFFQMIYSLQTIIAQMKGDDFGTVRDMSQIGACGYDFHYLEDDEFLELLKQIEKEYN